MMKIAQEAFCVPMAFLAFSNVVVWIPIIGANVCAWCSTSFQVVSFFGEKAVASLQTNVWRSLFFLNLYLLFLT